MTAFKMVLCPFNISLLYLVSTFLCFKGCQCGSRFAILSVKLCVSLNYMGT
uniref:Uncharacterized protein n=1 Tax=Xenopus tropicalis TaxID=8364 RepID=A0A1B8XUQ6_XENTR